MIDLLQFVPNLRNLIVRSTCLLTGHQWKKIAIDHLPNIKKLKFEMCFNLEENGYTKQQLDELFDTFRTPFWINEHQWFVRCHWQHWDLHHDTQIYTIPYCFDKLINFHQTIWCKSTCPNHLDYWSYDSVHTASLGHNLDRNWPLYPMRLPKLTSLVIEFPMHPRLWKIIPNVNYLTSMSVRQYGNTKESELLYLFSRAPNLYSLTINRERTVISMPIKTTSIRKLNFTKYSDNGSFDIGKCSALVQSSLGRQCEILTVAIQTRSNVLDLVQTMPNLRILFCHCHSDRYNNEFIDWLRDHLPPMCTFRKVLGYSSEIEILIKK
ncbi:unnamed protein product [Rotaria sp. Silwood2]|nr:unnamed protein product [Rotaria sp. Silwood2]